MQAKRHILFILHAHSGQIGHKKNPHSTHCTLLVKKLGQITGYWSCYNQMCPCQEQNYCKFYIHEIWNNAYSSSTVLIKGYMLTTWYWWKIIIWCKQFVELNYSCSMKGKESSKIDLFMRWVVSWIKTYLINSIKSSSRAAHPYHHKDNISTMAWGSIFRSAFRTFSICPIQADFLRQRHLIPPWPQISSILDISISRTNHKTNIDNDFL